jgi:signal transduction histidine kinase
MKIIRRIISFYHLSVDEKAIYQNEIILENTKRAFYISLAAIPVSIIHIIIFGLKLKDTVGIEQQWVVSIILAHIIILTITTICSILLYYFPYRTKRNNTSAIVCANVILILLLVMGTLITAIDQYVTSSITPFINTTLIIALVFLIRPLYATIYYIAAYAFFCIALTQTQLSYDVLVSNQVNGLTITAAGLCLSYLLWSLNLTRIKQKHEIIKQNNALVEINNEKDKFFSIIAHDLKSPFNSILGFNELLLEQIKKKDYENIEEFANLMLQSSNNAVDLLSNLMTWSQSQSGRMEFNPVYFEIASLIEESTRLLNDLAGQKSIKIESTISSAVPVFADKEMISTILRNLISNAIKFTNIGGKISISVDKIDETLKVTIRDNGVGILRESLDTIFNIAGSESTLGTLNEKGTGLGLILCKEFIEKNNGKIWVESKAGIGSSFSFSLPTKAKVD